MTPEYDIALRDLKQGVRDWRMWGRLGWRDVRRRYSRSVIGPLWSTISLGIFTVAMSLVWSRLWHMDPQQYLPFISAGLICWTLITTILTDSCIVFNSAESLIKTKDFPLSLLVCAMTWRSLLVFAHNFLIYIAVVVYCRIPLNANSLLIVPGLMLVCVNGVWIGLLLGMFGARFRDLQQLIISLLQVAFFVTPIFWQANLISGRLGQLLVNYNVLLHYVEIVRRPMLGEAPLAYTWLVVCACTVAGSLVALGFFSRFRRRIAYWL